MKEYITVRTDLNDDHECFSSPKKEEVHYLQWTRENSKLLLDLYYKYESKVGTLQIRTLKKLWEVIALKINEITKLKVLPSHCENRWRVLERGYKNFKDNNKTKRGRRHYDYTEQMENILKKKHNIQLMTSENEEYLVEIEEPAIASGSEVISSNDVKMEEHIIITSDLNDDLEYNPSLQKEEVNYLQWTRDNSKLLLDLYYKYKNKVGTRQIRTLKKLWELIAVEINEVTKLQVLPSHCENRWRVLERGYKNFKDNNNKTGRGRKHYDYTEEMEKILKIEHNILPNDQEENTVAPVDEKRKTPKLTKTILSRNRILENMRRDRLKYYKRRLAMESQRLQIEELKLDAMERRNLLIEERNQILALNKTD